MRKLQLLGLVLFVAGFTVFLCSFFIPHYKITPAHWEVIADENKRLAAVDKAEHTLREVYGFNFHLVNDLQQVFESVNLSLLKTYALSETDKAQIAATQSLDNPFSIQKLEDVFDVEDEVQEFKLQAFQSYGGWLDGRSYTSGNSLTADIDIVAANISKYGITSKFGFDDYEIKNYKYEITRIASGGWINDHKVIFLWLTYGLCIIGGLLYILPNYQLKGEAGIKNDGIFHSKLKNRGWLGVALGVFLIAFYIILYFYPEYMTPWVITVDPISLWIKNSEAGRFFLYGFIYTLCILVMGVRMMIHYRHSKYQIFRTLSVMFFQTAFAFTIPEILIRLNKPYFDFKNIWPLDYDFFFDNELQTLLDSGTLGIFMLGWGIGLIILGVPIFVYFFGKRWYCSWVCGCGGLAETLGDPFRQLSDKSLKAWKVERWMIHSVLVFVVVMTGAVLYTFWTGESRFLGIFDSYQIRSVYGAWIGAGFAGVVGTGFYPLMGNRVWCRFGCPLAAYLGIIQRFKSRFRITTNGGQCISCGNCSTYCEMGIDVRWYAQRGQNIVRSSCVGCGICSAVCPRGVLNLENASEEGRFGKPILIGNDSIDLEA